MDSWLDHDEQTAPSASLERTYRRGTCTLTVRLGNLLDSDADVIVSSDDYLLSAGGGVSLAIARAGGTSIAVDASKHVPRRLGDVVVTTAGALPAKYVFHAVTIGRYDDDPVRGSGADQQFELVSRITERCLSLARILGMRSIAFPAIGSGVAGLAIPAVATGMAQSIASEFDRVNDGLHVSLVLMAKRWQSDLEYVSFFEELGHVLRTKPEAAAPVVESIERSERVEQQRREILDTAQRQARAEEQLATATSDADRAELTHTLASTTAALAKVTSNRSPVRLFISYSRRDLEEAQELMSHLASLKRSDLVVWSDREIPAGADWEDEIHQALEAAEIGLFLISARFIESEYCTGTEWRRAREREAAGEMRMIPIIMRPCHWQPLVGDLQALPGDGQALSQLPDRDQALLEITLEVERLSRVLRPAGES